jgi:hypothetical protein
MEKQNGFIGTCTREEFACGWAWRLRAIHAGSSDCWQNSVLSCGSVKRIKKQKTDRKDAQLLLRLMREDTFPKIWVPSPENRDLRQLLWHRHRLVQMRTRIMNQLQAIAMNEGKRKKTKLWSVQGRAELEKLALAPWTSRRRQELLELLDRIDPVIEELSKAAEQEAKKRPEVVRLMMTHPGVQADRHLRGDDSERGLQWWKATFGHQQTRQFLTTLFAGGGRTGGGTRQPGVESPVHSSGDASAQEHCQGSDGRKLAVRLVAPSGCSSFLFSFFMPIQAIRWWNSERPVVPVNSDSGKSSRPLDRLPFVASQAFRWK